MRQWFKNNVLQLIAVVLAAIQVYQSYEKERSVSAPIHSNFLHNVAWGWVAVAGLFLISALLNTFGYKFRRTVPQGSAVPPAPSGKPEILIFPSGVALNLIYARKVGQINLQFLSTEQVKLTYISLDLRGRSSTGGNYLHSWNNSEPTTIPKGSLTMKIMEAKFTESEMLDFALGAPVSMTGHAKFDYGHPTESLHVHIDIQTVPLWANEPPKSLNVAKECNVTVDDPRVLLEYAWS